MTWTPECVPACWARPICATCGRPKKPRGRDSRDSGLCDSECDGYGQGEQPGHLWPGEGPDRAALEEAR